MIYELTFVITAISPKILSSAVRTILAILANIGFAIMESLSTCTWFLGVHKLALITISMLIDVYSKALNFAMGPFADVTLFISGRPNPRAMLSTIAKLPFIYLAVRPFEESFPLFDPFLEVSLIFRSIRKFFIAWAILQVVSKLSFVKPSIIVKNDACAMFLTIFV